MGFLFFERSSGAFSSAFSFSIGCNFIVFMPVLSQNFTKIVGVLSHILKNYNERLRSERRNGLLEARVGRDGGRKKGVEGKSETEVEPQWQLVMRSGRMENTGYRPI